MASLEREIFKRQRRVFSSAGAQEMEQRKTWVPGGTVDSLEKILYFASCPFFPLFLLPLHVEGCFAEDTTLVDTKSKVATESNQIARELKTAIKSINDSPRERALVFGL